MKGKRPGEGWFKVPDSIFEMNLSHYAILVLLYLLRRAGPEGTCYPKTERICKDCGIKAVNTVKKALRELLSRNLITITPRGPRMSNLYTIAPLLRETLRRKGGRDKTTHETKPSSHDTFGDVLVSSRDPLPSSDDVFKYHHMTPKEYTGKENPLKEKEVVEDLELVTDMKLMEEAKDYFASLTPKKKQQFDSCALGSLDFGCPQPEPGSKEMVDLRARYYPIHKNGISTG